jgi:hypothetical protein
MARISAANSSTVAWSKAMAPTAKGPTLITV